MVISSPRPRLPLRQTRVLPYPLLLAVGTVPLVAADSSQIVAPAVAVVVEAAARVEGETPGVAYGTQAVGMAFPRAGLAFAHRGWDRLGVGRGEMVCRGRELEEE